MIYVGIDVAAEKHACCILTESGKVLKQFTFSNDMPGFEKFHKALLTPSETKIGLGKHRRIRKQSGRISQA